MFNNSFPGAGISKNTGNFKIGRTCNTVFFVFIQVLTFDSVDNIDICLKIKNYTFLNFQVFLKFYRPVKDFIDTFHLYNTEPRMLQHKVSIVTKKMPNFDELTICGYVQQ